MNYQIDLADLPVLPQQIPDAYRTGVTVLPDGCAIHYYRHPGATFPESVADALYGMFVPVTSYAFGADMTGYWDNRRRGGHLENTHELALMTDAAQRLIGWSSYSVINEPVCTIVYNDSSGVIPPYQGKGIMNAVFKSRVADCLKNNHRPDLPLYFSTRTESPVIYRMRQRLMTRLYPHPDTTTPDRVVEHAQRLAAWLGQAEKFEPASLIVRNAYDMVDDLYGELPASGDPALDQWIYAQLGRADAFLLMGVVDR